MRIISETRLKRYWEANSRQRQAERSLRSWRAVVRAAAWSTPADVKLTFGKNVDFDASDNGSDLAVFNIHANHYRLIAAIHFVKRHAEKGRVYVLRIVTHREYDRNDWKRDL
jgi:mRNA interferase HigB